MQLAGTLFSAPTNILATYGVVKIEFTYLLTYIGKRSSGKIRPGCIKSKSELSKVEILQRAKKLKDHVTFKKVFITPDLTCKQQEVDKKLRDKLKEL